MTSENISKMFGSIRRQFEAGNIGWSNYKEKLGQLFQLGEELAENVAVLEKKMEDLEKKENPNG